MFEKEFRRIATRNIEFTEKEMESIRLRTVYNAWGDSEFMDDDFINRFYLENIRKGEYGLIEKEMNNKGAAIISLLVFEDIWSRNIYALAHWNLYKDKMFLVDLLN